MPRATNLWSAAMNSGVVRSAHNSRLIALVLKQTNTQMYALRITGRRVWPCLIRTGPAKSMPVVLNGGNGVVLWLGSSPMLCTMGLA